MPTPWSSRSPGRRNSSTSRATEGDTRMPALEDLYREIILDHYRAPRNRGELPVPPAHKVEGYNPLCGDEVVLYLEVDGDTVTDLKIAGQGCSISQASTSMMSNAVKGVPVAEARRLIRAFKALMSIHESKLERYFALAGIVAAMGFAVSITLFNVDAAIVKFNVYRSWHGKNLNVPHLASLSADAVPAL